MSIENQLRLAERAGLPDPLRVLVAEIPREQWDAHPNFSGLVKFWLDRHVMFRRLSDMLLDDSAKALDREMEAGVFAARLSRLGGHLVGDLHGHHQIEDYHYFPKLKALDNRLDAGFELLESDHGDMDELLAEFTNSANAVLGEVQAGREPIDTIAAYQTNLQNFGQMLLRHLDDEEDLIVPVILNSGFGEFD